MNLANQRKTKRGERKKRRTLNKSPGMNLRPTRLLQMQKRRKERRQKGTNRERREKQGRKRMKERGEKARRRERKKEGRH